MKALLLGFALATTGLGAERTVLLLDYHDIHCRAGTRRVLEKPVRHAANPVITEKKPWEMAIAWTSVHYGSGCAIAAMARETDKPMHRLTAEEYAGTIQH